MPKGRVNHCNCTPSRWPKQMRRWQPPIAVEDRQRKTNEAKNVQGHQWKDQHGTANGDVRTAKRGIPK